MSRDPKRQKGPYRDPVSIIGTLLGQCLCPKYHPKIPFLRKVVFSDSIWDLSLTRY